MPDRDHDRLEELRELMRTASPGIRRLALVVAAILRPPPAEPPTSERRPTLH